MSRQVTAFRLLVERPIAKRFGQATVGMKAGRIALHLRSVLAAAIINPSFLLPSISSGRALSLQLGKQRGHQRPVLLAVYCNDSQDRDSLRRLLLALTSEVAGLVGGPVLPDASSVLRALLAEWLNISSLNRPDEAEEQARSNPEFRSLGRQKPLPPKSSRRSPSTTKARPTRRKPYGWTSSADRVVPHSEFPSLSSIPVDWRPGKKGRPPVGSYQSKDGKWHLPNGFKLIDGQVYPPMALFRDAASKRKHLRDAKKKAKKHRTGKSVAQSAVSKEATNEVEAVPQAAQEPSEKGTAGISPEQSPQDSSTEAPAGGPPSPQYDGGHPKGSLAQDGAP